MPREPLRAVATRPASERVDAREASRTLIAPGLLLGVGLGGFLDGIVLHQLLRWHHLISSTEKGSLETVAGLDNNTLADGVFHAATWLVTALVVWLLARNLSRGRVTVGRELVGWLILGWGAFNVADELLFHAVLDLHHVREGENELAYDMGFSAIALLQLVVGYVLVRSGRARLADRS